MRPGDRFTLNVEKAASGGRMLARHNGRVVLVAGAIPGERVAVRIDRVTSAVVFAETLDVLTPSADRRPASSDPRCGGCVLAHVDYSRQLRLKAEIVQDAFSRIARLPLTDPPSVVSSPEQGYRMRARLHVEGARIGFFREGSHQLCDATATGQLSNRISEWIQRAERFLQDRALSGLAGIEVAENIPGDQVACHLEMHGGVDPREFAPIAAGLKGVSAQRADRPDITVLDGDPVVVDLLQAEDQAGSAKLTLRRDVRSFFQSNRFLVQKLAQHVTAQVPPGPVIDLYAGVGLFGLSLAATGRASVTAVEGDPIGGADLQRNAEPFGERVTVERRNVEAFVASRPFGDACRQGAVVIVDPPRTGLSQETLRSVVQNAPASLVYVSCDPATLARDVRGLVNGGLEVTAITLFDMFPNTAHVEAVVTLRRG